MGRIIALVLAAALAACTSSKSSGGNATGTNGPACVQHGSVVTCEGVAFPACGTPRSGSCDPNADAGCAGCNGPAGYTCSCARDVDAGWLWRCLGTGGPCQ